jgi:hypothetical protein
LNRIQDNNNKEFSMAVNTKRHLITNTKAEDAAATPKEPTTSQGTEEFSYFHTPVIKKTRTTSRALTPGTTMSERIDSDNKADEEVEAAFQAPTSTKRLSNHGNNAFNAAAPPPTTTTQAPKRETPTEENNYVRTTTPVIKRQGQHQGPWHGEQQ